MSRPLRILIEDGWYHVFGRGTERRDLFTTDRDREHFLDLLSDMHERYRVRIHAYALMDNHYHTILQTPDANLDRAMQWLHGSYSTWFNARHNRVGPLFQGRYKAVMVEDSRWAYALSLYIHLNPLRVAGLGLDRPGRVLEGRGFSRASREQVAERLQRLRTYRWSAYRAYAGYAQAPFWLEQSELLSRAHHDKSRQRSQYRLDVRTRLCSGVEPSVSERLRDCIAVGSAAFATQVRRRVEDTDLHGISDKRELAKRASLDDVRKAVEHVREEAWEDFAERHGDWGLALFLWAARRLCGQTLREIGKAAGGMREAAVGMAIRRFEDRVVDDPAMKERQRRVVDVLDVKP